MLRGEGLDQESDLVTWTGSGRAATVTSIALLLAFPSRAHALAVTSFAPRDVTTGTRLTIKGDFAELAVLRVKPEVTGQRSDTPKVVKFQVLALSRRTLIARVREVPSTKSDPAAGKDWSLVVRSPLRGGETVEADDDFTTVGPALVAVPAREAMPGEILPLYALDPGAKPPSVIVGRKKAKVLRSAPAGESADGDPWLVQFRAPRLRNGFYPLRLENSLGPAPGGVPLLIYGSTSGGLSPYASVAIDGLPGLDTSLCSWSERGGRLRLEACADESCERSLALEFEPDPQGGYAAALVELSDADEGLELASELASAKLLPSPAPELLAGAFVATLRRAHGAAGPPLFARGYFQAPSSDSLPVTPP
jgi:hypothetical protein